MNIALGADHRGFELKETVKGFLQKLGHQVKDCGCVNKESCDYPDYAFLVAQAVSGGECDRGILFCATGIGMSIAANKVPGIRAALICNKEVAALSRKHNNSNVLCLGSDVLAKKEINDIIEVWLGTFFSEEPRHLCRIGKIDQIEKNIQKR